MFEGSARRVAWPSQALCALVAAAIPTLAGCPLAADLGDVSLRGAATDGGSSATDTTATEPSPRTDSGSAARCVEGRADCDGSGACATVLASDPSHCGRCERACDDGSVCSKGECVARCDDGLVKCGQACVDTTTHPDHCGTCDKPCAARDRCEGGTCKTCTPSCAGKRCGDPDGCDGLCQSGSCDAGQRCVQGACVCDAQSCAGCCRAGTCMTGESANACGEGGAACRTCTTGTACDVGACVPYHVRCLGEDSGAGSIVKTCRAMCDIFQDAGCVSGVLAAYPTGVGFLANDLNCTPASLLGQITSCDSTLFPAKGQSVGCFCKD